MLLYVRIGRSSSQSSSIEKKRGEEKRRETNYLFIFPFFENRETEIIK